MSELNKYDGAIKVFSREKISILTPKENNYKIIDIAKGLGYKPHFSGQTPYFFSIAQHSIMTDDIYCEEMSIKGKIPDPHFRFGLLMHDCTEAYLPDMPKPYKVLMQDFIYFENKMEEAMFEAFNIPILMKVNIKPYDILSQKLEEKAFYGNGVYLNPLGPDEAVEAFLVRYWEIINLIILNK